jgi:diacylglycerol O-acyltransferase
VPASERLTGLDSAFLAVETPTAPMHMTAVVTLAPRDGRPARLEEIRRHLAPRIRSLPVLRRRLREVPLGLDHPVWIDGDVDLDAHIHRVVVPPPGSDGDLQALVGDLTTRPLDRDRPLWDLWVVEGLEGGMTALVMKVHHSLIDGVAGAEIFGRLFDVDADASADPPGRVPAPQSAARSPSRTALLARATRALAGRPLDLVRQSARSVVSLGRRALSAGGPAGRAPVLPATAALPAPDSPLSGAISGRRQVTLGSLPLDDLKDLASGLGVTLNDVVLELCTSALHRDLVDAGGGVPRDPLVAAVPVSTVGRRAGHDSGNRVSAVTIELPVHLTDPLGRLANIHRAMTRAKRAHRALHGDLLAGWAEVAPPILLSGLATLYSWLDLADRHRPVVNLIVSNVPGPRDPLYCAGHRIDACHPLGPIWEGCALNLTVMSYGGRLHFGWITCPDVVPDVSRMGAFLPDAAEELRDLAADERRHRGAGATGGTAAVSRGRGPARAGAPLRPAPSR